MRHLVRWGLLIASLGVVLGACTSSNAVSCADGRVCPSGTTCDDNHVLCVSDRQREACANVADGDMCQFDSQIGICDLGICIPTACGNGIVDANEACDDGNTESGDTCRADCRKVEVCGDAILDDGEACDDGNDNAVDGCDSCAVTTWAATAVLGAAPLPTTFNLGNPQHIAVDGNGYIYVADRISKRVFRIANGVVSVVAGSGSATFSGDGGPATAAGFTSPIGVAADGLGNVYISDDLGHRVRRVDANGIITTVAGTGTPGIANDGGPATAAQLDSPRGLAVDGLGNLYIADALNNRIRRVDTTGVIVTVAGTGAFGSGGDGGPATSAQLVYPEGVSVSPDGSLVIADTANHRIREVDTAGEIRTVAGTDSGYAGDGGLATAAQLRQPFGAARAADGTLYIADTYNHVVRKVTPAGTITTLAGTPTTLGFTGDGGPAMSGLLNYPQDVAVSGSGAVLVADQANGRIRSITNGTLATLAGGAEGASATTTAFATPFGVAFDAMNRMYVAIPGEYRVVRINADGTRTTVAGTGVPGYNGDGIQATVALLRVPRSIAFDSAGNLYIADVGNHRVRKVDTAGIITTIAGTGSPGYTGDDGAATAAALNQPIAIAIDSTNKIAIADYINNAVRLVTGTTITTVAGTGSPGFTGDGAAATAAQLNGPIDVAFDAMGHLYIADQNNHRVRKVDSGTITTVAGDGSVPTSCDVGAALSTAVGNPLALAVDAGGRLLIADADASCTRRLESGDLVNIAGNGSAPIVIDGDGGLATSASVHAVDLAPRADGLVLVDRAEVVRRIDSSGTITSIAGKLDPEGSGALAQAHLADPRALVATPAGLVFAGGSSGTLQALRAAALETVAGRYPNANPTGMLARFRSKTFGAIGGLAFDATENKVYVSSSSSLYAITMVDPANASTWTMTTLANTDDEQGWLDGAAATARFFAPTGLYLDEPARKLYIADTGNQLIRVLDLTSSTVATFAGSRVRGYGGDGGAATSARFNNPRAIAACPGGDLFVADTENHRVRRIAGGMISTVLGDGSPSSSGEGAPATSFSVNAPLGLACDADGNLFVTSTTALRVLPERDGIVDGTGPVHTIFGAAPRDTFPASVTSCLTGVQSVDAATVRVTDACTGMLIELTR